MSVRPSLRTCALWTLASLALSFGCGGAKPQTLPRAPRAPSPVEAETEPLPAAAAPETERAHDVVASALERWYFEWLSKDGKRVLLRRLDARSRYFHARVVDVDSGATLQEAKLDSLAKIPFATTFRGASDFVALDSLLHSQAFEDDLVHGARLLGGFPFGSCGRVSAAPDGGAIAFNAGDWLYVADKTGHVRRALTQDAAYDPRFSPDGKHILFRQFTGKLDRVFAKYELFVVPSDLSAAPRRLDGTVGARDPFVVSADGQSAVTVASHEPLVKTCVLSIGLRPPFAVKKLACVDGGEHLVEAVLSPRGKWAALTTRDATPSAERSRNAKVEAKTTWRLRVLSLSNGKVALDADAEPGVAVHAVSDDGLLVQTGPNGVVVDDVPAKKHRTLAKSIELGYRGVFRKPTELVFVKGRDVGVVDLAKD